MIIRNLICAVLIYACLLFHLLHGDSSSCTLKEDGSDYEGHVNISQSKRICIPWIRSKIKFSLKELKLKSLDENFCRNPDGRSNVWCNLNNGDSEYCDVPMCPVNPGAKFCIPIPKNNFQFCPSMFARTNLFQGNLSHTYIFCCLKNEYDLNSLPITNECLMVIIGSDFIKPQFILCPSGYTEVHIMDRMIENKSIYKCCKHTKPKDLIRLSLINITINQNLSTSLPIFGTVTNQMCQNIADFYTEIVEYINLNSEIANLSLSLKRICLYYIVDQRKKSLREADLGFASLKNCPVGFTESSNSNLYISENRSPIKNCWPKFKNYIYPPGQYCLLINENNFDWKCPKDLQVFAIRSIAMGKEVARFCCKIGDDPTSTIVWMNEIKENESIGFVTTTGECPFMIFNGSVSNSLIKVDIDSGPRNKSSRTINDSIVKLSMCNYHLSKDTFAYKKVGKVCPPGMVSSSIVFGSLDDSDRASQEFTIEYCVGEIVSYLGTFPTGKYCLYRIGDNCPFGFIDSYYTYTNISLSKNRSPIFHQFQTQSRIIKKTNGIVPNYMKQLFCCRNDGNNQQILSVNKLPFMSSGKLIPFGLYVRDRNDRCPLIGGLVDYHEVDHDGFLCTYREEKDFNIWLNEVIYPTPAYGTEKNYFIKETWVSLTKFQYMSSVIIAYPRSTFCFVSSSRCISIKNIKFVIPYPINNRFLCCSLDDRNVLDHQLPSNSTMTYETIAFVSIKQECPKIDESVYSYQNVVEEMFEIENKYFDKSYGFDLMKIGIMPDFLTKPGFIRLIFRFCIFNSVHSSLTDYISLNSNGFMKPLQSVCPYNFIERSRSIYMNFKSEMDTISSHFIQRNPNSNLGYATFCFPRIKIGGYHSLVQTTSLCTFSFIACANGTDPENIDLGSRRIQSMFKTSFHICCHNSSTNSIEIPDLLPIPFSLPLKPMSQFCPIINKLNSEKWEINLFQPQQFKILTFCLYYQISKPMPWPSGTYLTVPFEDRCPSLFHLLRYSNTAICIRNESKTISKDFPRGYYCILSYLDIPCPSSGVWNSTNQLINVYGKSYLLCCSKIADMILNIPIPDDHFSFLSLEKCSIVPGTFVLAQLFSPDNQILRCIYTRKIIAFRKKNEIIILTPAVSYQKVISIILVVLLVALIVILITFGIIFKKKKDQSSNLNNQSNQIQLMNFDNQSDTTSFRIYSEIAPSVAYSTLS